MKKNSKWKKIMLPLLAALALSLSACGTEKTADNETLNENAADTDEGNDENFSSPEDFVEEPETVEGGSEEFAVDKIDRSDEGYELVWSDEFDGDTLDTTKWCAMHGNGRDYGIEDWGNSEQEYYSADNITVEDGKLVITIKYEDMGGKHFTSGRLRTMTDDGEPLFATTYGRVEAKIRMTGTDGIWPAFWMLPVDSSIYGTWAASGELDIMEAMGRLHGKIGGTAHYGKIWPENVYSTADFNFPEGTDITDYHTYSMEWTPEFIKWYVDDQCYSTLQKWYAQGDKSTVPYKSPAPFDVPFYIILNVAVGGTFDPVGVPTERSLPAGMEVDFVRVFQKTDGYETDTPVKVDYGIEKIKPTGHMVYNDTFDEGEDRLAFWTVEGLDAKVDDLKETSTGEADYSRAVDLSLKEGETEAGSIYQDGIVMEAGKKYGLAFNIHASEQTFFRVTFTGSDGTVYIDEEMEVPSVEGMRTLKYTTEYQGEENEEDAELRFYVGEGGTISLDSVVYTAIK
ncbi:MAG: glycoside hydrolase family 16 protein [Acetatifactor sp.]|nr:glycoside hydrolase family 16 protein [Acetatifactor sp.]